MELSSGICAIGMTILVTFQCFRIFNCYITAFRFGRKVGMTVSSIGALLVVVGESFSPSVEFYSLCRLLLGFFSYGATLSTFVFGISVYLIYYMQYVPGLETTYSTLLPCM